MEPKSSASRKDKTRWDEFLDVSQLYAQERGTLNYRLIVHPNLHDRWLLLDQSRVFQLGGSLKDAGRKAFTITQLDTSPENLAKIQNHVSQGEELFGPSTPQHAFRKENN